MGPVVTWSGCWACGDIVAVWPGFCADLGGGGDGPCVCGDFVVILLLITSVSPATVAMKGVEDAVQSQRERGTFLQEVR